MSPWHEVVQLRDDLKSGELPLAVFAADLYDVVMQRGHRPVYEQPAQFFALTYPTLNLRELVKDVALRLAGRSDKAYRKLAVNYGGGKTHTLIALRHLVHDPGELPDLPAVREFEAHSGFKAPRTRVAALCFDKIDIETGVETPGPDGQLRKLRYPSSVLAWQLAGSHGLRLIHADAKDAERETPPAEPLLVELLAKPQADDLSTLVLLDEVLMYLRVQMEVDPSWRGRLISFFQYLTQAVVKVDRCAMVASLLASDQRRHDALGNDLLRDVSEVFGRQMEEDASPVSKEDVAQVLRRRFFTPDSIRDQDLFRPHVAATVGSIAALDEQTAKERAPAEQRYLDSYPFHPELTDIFYTRWTQLDGFQRTRGILRAFAIALRDAERWDNSPLIGPNVFTTIKADRRSRIQETSIRAEAMLPGGPYDLWREDEQAAAIVSDDRLVEVDHPLRAKFTASCAVTRNQEGTDVMRDTDTAAWPPADSVLDWLLDSDPSIRWQVLQDLVDVDNIAAERARVADEGWGRRLLDEQRPDGQWGDGEAHPFWWTNLYTLLYLRDLGVDPESDRTRHAIERVHSSVTWGPWHGDSPFFEGEEEPCINGRVVALGAYFGKPSLRLVDLLLGEQLGDGGWNCEAHRGSVRSSFHTTICVLEGLLAHEHSFGEDPAITAARERGAEYLLERHLLRRLSTGGVIDEGWRRLAFPPLWHYDVLRGLECAVTAGFKDDPRLAEAIETVASRQLPDGRWRLDVRHKDTLYEEIAGAPGEPNRWITLRALRALRRLRQ